VELLIAMTLMTIGVFAVMGMQIVAMNANTISNQLSVANSLAQEVLEDVMSWDPGQSLINTSQTVNYQFLNPTGTAYTQNLVVNGAGTYRATCQTTVGTSANGVPVGVTRVLVTVTYTFKGGSNSVSITGSKRTV
jgi:Tfp pilus assembly protein PilV